MHADGDVLWHGDVQREVRHWVVVKGVTRVCGLILSVMLALCFVKACWVLLCEARVWRRACVCLLL